jgi:hypothetical protein
MSVLLTKVLFLMHHSHYSAYILLRYSYLALRVSVAKLTV